MKIFAITIVSLLVLIACGSTSPVPDSGDSRADARPAAPDAAIITTRCQTSGAGAAGDQCCVWTPDACGAGTSCVWQGSSQNAGTCYAEEPDAAAVGAPCKVWSNSCVAGAYCIHFDSHEIGTCRRLCKTWEDNPCGVGEICKNVSDEDGAVGVCIPSAGAEVSP